MEIQYVYQKKRCEFGRQCMFSDKGPEIIDNYPSNKQMLNDYILKDPVNQETQGVPVQAEHYLNTTRAEFSNSAVNHTEGGWPKDVNLQDEEQTKRYRRKVEKDDSWYVTMMQLCKNMENCILQNNAINIYQQYFSDVEPTPLVQRSSARTVNVYQEQSGEMRPITHISWSPDNCSKLAISHCDMTFQGNNYTENKESYIWEVENPNTPSITLQPESPLICLEYNQKDPHSLISGQVDGLISIWDVRRGTKPVDSTVIETSHRDPVGNVLWINSKSGTEFFSASSDGSCKWWDTRKLTQPTEVLIIDPSKPEDQSMSRAMGVSVLEYESTIPTRFMIGTESGVVFSGNRKGKSPLEKMGFRYNAHLGPVLALQRNSAFVKNFLTIGDWTAKIWYEDCRESEIMWTSYHKPMLTDGAWSPTRFSVFFTTRTDGKLDVWDILQQQKHACLGVKVCDEKLTCLRTHDMGRLIAVGDQKGTTYLVELSENLSVSQKNDRPLLTAMFDREGRREKILEARNREIRLKLKAKEAETVTEEPVVENVEEGDEASVEKKSSQISWADNNVKAAEAEFFLIIKKEMKEVVDEIQMQEGEELEDDALGEDSSVTGSINK